ncbi:MAG: cation transporter [Chitinophagales bacterium]|nr:cation transporter [Chitinophagales bacterium]
MTHTYNITGMTCSGCEAKVKSLLLKLPEVLSADVSLNEGKATIKMSKHILLASLQEAISGEKKYVISEEGIDASQAKMYTEEKKSWITTYKPLLLIFGYITAISFITSFKNDSLNLNLWMNNFMAGFFLTFSFFKLLNIRGFADGYSTYDLLAKRWKPYGFIYPILELLFGVWLLMGTNQMWCYVLILLVMTFSTFGVINSLRKKQTIECACLGTIFNLPLGKVTLFEDLLMVAMSAVMLIMLL